MDMQSGRLKQVMTRLAEGRRLTGEETEKLFTLIMRGEVPPEQLAAILMALRLRGETVDELSGAVRAVRACMTILPDPPEDAMDVCGTGGDGLGTLNVSTAVAFVLAGLGVPVAKHGNRALSSRAGATDTLMALGIEPCHDLDEQSRRLREGRLAFLAAPLHHPAMRHAAPVRGALGFRTIFNLIGPLCNPAQVRRQMIGLYDARWLRPVVETLATLGAERVWAVHGETDLGGSDEITLAGLSHIQAWDDGRFLELILTPDMAGLPHRPIAAIAGGDPAHNASKLLDMLSGQAGAYRDTVLLNSAVALHVSGQSPILENALIVPTLLRRNVELAAHAIDTGLALSALVHAQQGPHHPAETAHSPHMIQTSGLS
ncbi:anthranilate phosphoribosyltransferase [Asaia krungthepensis]|uniref:Anthranilate phosphoribosyltransferase n=1 Tax=Asaia krungthepensis NRIC 0535 TaxID=1307925 RepID=A0ABQ0PXS8_9PROT|nr:anthranilate phosphoribosyltransferase [Asaia krungthepensis]GBQ84222.1 anthranilate phosphoribosyltransferase [Asaia krungthepensis NRIC 0535]